MSQKSNQKNPKVDGFFRNHKQWQDVLNQLRSLALDCDLTEELKWGKACYSYEKSNVAILQPFKETCALMFFKGALLKDPEGVLEKPGENSQAARRIMFTSVDEVEASEATLRAYLQEAIGIEQAGLKPEVKKNPEPVPAELQEKLDSNQALNQAFHALTPGRQRAYILYFSAPKQSKTRTTRVEKCTPQILSGKGLHDR